MNRIKVKKDEYKIGDEIDGKPIFSFGRDFLDENFDVVCYAYFSKAEIENMTNEMISASTDVDEIKKGLNHKFSIVRERFAKNAYDNFSELVFSEMSKRDDLSDDLIAFLELKETKYRALKKPNFKSSKNSGTIISSHYFVFEQENGIAHPKSKVKLFEGTFYDIEYKNGKAIVSSRENPKILENKLLGIFLSNIDKLTTDEPAGFSDAVRVGSCNYKASTVAFKRLNDNFLVSWFNQESRVKYFMTIKEKE